MAIHCTARTIREIMTIRPQTVGRNVPLRTLRDLFGVHQVNAFPVVDEGGTLLGIVTTLDLLRVFRYDRRRFLPDLMALWAEHVEDIMRRRVVTVSPGDPVTTTVDLMVSGGLSSVPVVERRFGKDRLVGMVGRSDVLRVLTFESDDAN
jgi:CBS-domain-containing membrane protein